MATSYKSYAAGFRHNTSGDGRRRRLAIAMTVADPPVMTVANPPAMTFVSAIAMTVVSAIAMTVGNPPAMTLRRRRLR